MKLVILLDCLVGTEAHSPGSVADIADAAVAKSLVDSKVAREATEQDLTDSKKPKKSDGK